MHIDLLQYVYTIFLSSIQGSLHLQAGLLLKKNGVYCSMWKLIEPFMDYAHTQLPGFCCLFILCLRWKELKKHVQIETYLHKLVTRNCWAPDRIWFAECCQLTCAVAHSGLERG